MNGSQLLESLQRFGLTSESYGHVTCLLDCWTASVQSAAFHPDSTSETRSITVVIASSSGDMQVGKLLAGGMPTTVGTALDDWADICNTAIDGATIVATSYIHAAFDEVGFSFSEFEDGSGSEMDSETRAAHLTSRLDWALTKRHLNRVAVSAMDMPEGERDGAIKALDRSYGMVDLVGKMLADVDGQNL